MFTPWGVEARDPIQADIRTYSSAGTQIIQPGHQDQGAKAKLHIHPESKTLLEITLGVSCIRRTFKNWSLFSYLAYNSVTMIAVTIISDRLTRTILNSSIPSTPPLQFT